MSGGSHLKAAHSKECAMIKEHEKNEKPMKALVHSLPFCHAMMG
jgi:hypothetical protein